MTQYCSGLGMMVRPLIAIENIPELSSKVLEVVGTTEGSDDLVTSMQNLVAQDRASENANMQSN
jgi:hypothetical protein